MMQFNVQQDKASTAAKTIIIIMIIACIALILASTLFPDDAFAKNAQSSTGKSEYLGVSSKSIFDPNGGGEGLKNGMFDIIYAATLLILPVGIIYSLWRSVYLAVFCFLAEVDPLSMLQDPRYSGNISSGGKKNVKSTDLGAVNREDAKKALFAELKHVIIGVTITLVAFIAIRALMMLALVIMGAGSSVTDGTTLTM